MISYVLYLIFLIYWNIKKKKNQYNISLIKISFNPSILNLQFFFHYLANSPEKKTRLKVHFIS